MLCVAQPVSREGVCFRAHGPTHPMDGSRPRSWARRTYMGGNATNSEGMSAPTCPHVCLLLTCTAPVPRARTANISS